jgi:hypothetical protein
MRGHAKGVAALGSPAFHSLHRPTGHAAVGVITSVPRPMAQNIYITAHLAKCAASRPQGGLCVVALYQTAVMQSFGPSRAAGCARTSSPVSHAHGLSCRAVASRSLGAPPFFYSQCGFAAWAFAPPTPPTLRALALRASASAGWPIRPAPQGAGLPPHLRCSLSLRSCGRRSVCHQGTANVQASQRAGRVVAHPITTTVSPWGPQPPYPQTSANALAQRIIKK